MGRILIAVLGSLLILQCVQAMSPLGRRRCLCLGRLSHVFAINQLKKLEVFPKSPKCENLEVVAKMKNGDVKCLNPRSRLVKMVILKAKARPIQASGI